MRLRRVADELLGKGRHRLAGIFTEPAVPRIVVQHVGALRRTEEGSPLVQNRPDVVIDFVVDERRPAAGCRHRPVENRIEREPDQAILRKLRRVIQNHIEQPKHMLIVTHLRQSGGRLHLALRNFAEHLRKEHVRLGVVLDEVPEVFDDRFQRPGVLFRLRHDLPHPGGEGFPIPGHPPAGGERLVHRFDCCTHDAPPHVPPRKRHDLPEGIVAESTADMR